MSDVFKEVYADAYDALYADKDYAAECDLVEEVFARHGDRIARLLDVGCGTGGHALVFSRRGYSVTGVDLSAEMLAHACTKADVAGADIRWVLGDARSVEAGGEFDAVLLMFAVLSYQLENADVSAVLANARRHLREGGLLVLDTWYGPGVLVDPPRDRTKRVGGVVREASAELDVRAHLCRVRYRVTRSDVTAEETHVVRFFFPLELELYLELAGFEVILLAPFGSLDRELDDKTWNVLLVARAV